MNFKASGRTTHETLVNYYIEYSLHFVLTLLYYIMIKMDSHGGLFVEVQVQGASWLQSYGPSQSKNGQNERSERKGYHKNINK